MYTLVCRHTCDLSVWCCFGFVFSSEPVCVCVCSFSLADLQGSQSFWALTPPVRGGVEELQCGWVGGCGEDTVRWDDSTWITTWSICYTRRQKVKRDLRAHMDWEEVGFRLFVFFVTSKVTSNQNVAFLFIPLSHCLICQCTLFKTLKLRI